MTAIVDPFWYAPIAAAIAGGASMGFLGVYIVGMRIPFIGTCVSHAAMAGAVWAAVLGIDPTAGAVVAAVITAGAVAPLSRFDSRLDTNTAVAILFSFMLGLAFLGMGLNTGSRSEILSLMWGTVLLADWARVGLITLAAVGLFGFAAVFGQKLKAILFSRSISAATGIHSGFIFTMFLCLCGAVLSVNLLAVGGLLIFSLITNPAAAAYQLCRGQRSVVAVSVVLGIVAALGGLCCSIALDLPVGACIVLISTAIFGLAAAVRAAGWISH